MASDSRFGDLSETTRSLLVEELDLSDNAAWAYIKTVRVLCGKPCSGGRMFSGESNGKEDEFKLLEKDGIGYLGVDGLHNKGFNLRGSSAIFRVLVWAAARGQLEGVFGAPPRPEEPGELATKQMFVWVVADQASKEFQARRPYFLMEVPLKRSLWGLQLWRAFSEEKDVPILEMTEVPHVDKYHLVTNLEVCTLGGSVLMKCTWQGS